MQDLNSCMLLVRVALMVDVNHFSYRYETVFTRPTVRVINNIETDLPFRRGWDLVLSL